MTTPADGEADLARDERLVRDALDRSAARIGARPDLDDLLRRRARSDRRRTHVLLSATVATAVLVLVTGLVSVLRNPERAQIRHTTPPPVRTAPASTKPCNLIMPGPLGRTVEEVTLRRVAAGVSLRVEKEPGATCASVDGFAPWWRPPTWCLTNANLTTQVGVSGKLDTTEETTRAVTVQPGRLRATMGIVGREGDRVRWVALVQVPRGATRVTGEFPFSGGRRDSAEVVQGIAPLTVTEPLSMLKAEGSPLRPAVRFTAYDANGRPVAEASAPGDIVDRVDPSATSFDLSSEDRSACTAPKTLPPPGVRGPADPAAARAAIDAALRRAVASPFATDDVVFVPAGQAPLGMEYGTFARNRGGAITKLVFTDQATAYFSFPLTVTVSAKRGTPLSSPTTRTTSIAGEARLIGGRWKISQNTWGTFWDLGQDLATE